MMSLPFHDREDAARRLIDALMQYKTARPVVLAIPRGAVPMGRMIADALNGELDVVLVRKLGAPGNPELAIGAVDEQGTVTLNEHAQWAGGDEAYVKREAQRQLALIGERRARYRPSQPSLALTGRTVIVIDDGLATGSTMIAALKSARARGAGYLVCAVPVAADDSLAQVARFADAVVCLARPWPFVAVGQHYFDFTGVTDEQVIQALAADPSEASSHVQVPSYPVHIPAGGIVLPGDLASPASPRGLVIFAHGSGSSRYSSRNRFVAAALHRRGFATLLFDLLSLQEDRNTAARFDIALLAQRLESALDWARRESSQSTLPIGLFGASTGAAAALRVAAVRPIEIAAVVSRGGRPDLAGTQALTQVRTHTLLIVGGDDRQVLELNRAAKTQMRDWAELIVIPGASHLFEEPGALEQMTAVAADWFDQRLQRAEPKGRGVSIGQRPL